MHKIILLITLLSSPFFILANQVIEYDSKYMGLEVGKSRTFDVINALGEPIDKFKSKANMKYVYRSGIFVFNLKTKKINSIIITNPDYQDFNGMSIGDGYNMVVSLPNIVTGNEWAFDQDNGVVYWFDKHKIIKIIYLHQAKNS